MPATALLRVDRSGFVPFVIRPPLDDEPRALRMVPSVEIVGQVVDSNSGAAVPGAAVSLSRLRGEIPLEARVTADSAGKFHFSGLPPGLFQLRASGQDFASRRATFIAAAVPAGVDLHPVVVSVTRGHSISGSLGFLSRPSPGAARRYSLSAVNTENGDVSEATASVGVPGDFVIRGASSGTYIFKLRADGAESSSDTIGQTVVGDSDVANVALQVRPGFQIQGKVLPATSGKVELVRVDRGEGSPTFQLVDAGSAIVDASGAFAVEGLQSGTYAIAVTTDDHRYSRQTVKVEDRDYRDLVIDLNHGSRISGQIGGYGAAAQGGRRVTVTPALLAERDWHALFESDSRLDLSSLERTALGPYNAFSTETDDAGRFSIRGLRRGHYKVALNDAWTGEQNKNPKTGNMLPIFIDLWGVTDTARVTAPPCRATLAGRVESETGGAVPDVRVSAIRLLGDTPSAGTDDWTTGTGSFNFAHLCRGRYFVRAEAVTGELRFASREVELSSDSAFAHLRLRPAVSIPIRVSAGGELQSSFRWSLEGPTTVHGFCADCRERPLSALVEAGTYALYIENDKGYAVRPVELAQSETQPLELELRAWSSLRGQLRGAKAGQFPCLLVPATQRSPGPPQIWEETRTATLDHEGRFYFPRIKSRTWILTLADANHGCFSAAFAAARGRENKSALIDLSGSRDLDLGVIDAEKP